MLSATLSAAALALLDPRKPRAEPILDVIRARVVAGTLGLANGRTAHRLLIARNEAKGSVAEGQHTHEAALKAAEGQLRNQGFEILSHDDSFIDRPGDASWWLAIGRKPRGTSQ